MPTPCLDASPQQRLQRLRTPSPALALRRAEPPLATNERMAKLAQALAHTPDALDLLHVSLSKVLEQPHNERLRKVKLSSGVFKERVADKSNAGIELLLAVGYVPMHGHLVLQKHDPSLLGAALAALTGARNLAAYAHETAALQSARARKEAADRAASASAARRAAHLANVPAEPTPGEDREASACVITVAVGEPPVRVTRRFDSDNTLNDLMNYIRSLPAVPERESLTIENVTTRPARLLDPASHAHASLYALDLWPIGQVQVR